MREQIRAHWGQGLANEGGRALVDHAFTHVGAERVSAETMAVNTASRRVTGGGWASAADNSSWFAFAVRH